MTMIGAILTYFTKDLGAPSQARTGQDGGWQILRGNRGPETLTIHAPALIPDTRRIADLALESNLVESVTATVLTAAIVRFTGDAQKMEGSEPGCHLNGAE